MIKIFRKISKTYLIAIIFMVFLSVILSVTYAVFAKDSMKHKVSEMYITQLMYGITINNENTNQVIVEDAGTTYYNIKVINLNDISTKYKLTYIAPENISVNISSTSAWNLEGELDEYGGTLYQKTIRVAVVNSTNTSSTINFSFKGGYSYNDTSTIPLGDFTAASNILINEHIALSNLSESLNEKVSDILDCTPTSNNPCLYTNEMQNNYVSYSEMIWRIMGIYLIDGEIVTKLVQNANYVNNIEYTNITNSLTTLYNSLEEKDIYLVANTKFLCSGLDNLSCTSHANYLNIGLVNKDEYINIGGTNSYLNSTNNYWTITNNGNQIYEITSNGEVLKNTSTTSGVRGTIYVNSEIVIQGTGIISDPYTLALPSSHDLEIAILLDGVSTDSLEEITSGYVLENYTCTNGATISWDYPSKSLTISQWDKTETKCTLEFITRPLLAQFAIQGQYIDYTGNNGCTGDSCKGCSASGSYPGNQCATGGYCISSTWRYNAYGWRVAYIDRNSTSNNYSDDSVYITTGGSPECMDVTPSSISSLNTASLKYCNASYAYGGICNSNSAWNINENDFQKILGNTSTLEGCRSIQSIACGNTNSIINNNGYYWFGNIRSNDGVFTSNVQTIGYGTSGAYGIRPIIRLATGITHDGTGNGTQADPYTLNAAY